MLSGLENTINRTQWISEAAYYKAETRNFESGRALDDWLEAEIDYSEMLIARYIAILHEDGPMTLLGLRELASLIGIKNPDRVTSESELVNEIQRATRHRPCFRSNANRPCEEQTCHWRTECQTLISQWYW